MRMHAPFLVLSPVVFLPFLLPYVLFFVIGNLIGQELMQLKVKSAVLNLPSQ